MGALYLLRSIRLDGELTSVKISHDSRFALVNQAPDVRRISVTSTAIFLLIFLPLNFTSSHLICECLITCRKFNYGTWILRGWYGSSLASDKGTMSFEVVSEASMATL